MSTTSSTSRASASVRPAVVHCADAGSYRRAAATATIPRPPRLAGNTAAAMLAAPCRVCGAPAGLRCYTAGSRGADVETFALTPGQTSARHLFHIHRARRVDVADAYDLLAEARQRIACVPSRARRPAPLAARVR